MLKICLVFWKSEPQYAYKRYAYKKKHVVIFRDFTLLGVNRIKILVSKIERMRHDVSN